MTRSFSCRFSWKILIRSGFKGVFSVGGGLYDIEQVFDRVKGSGVLPARLEQMEPGPVLAAFLCSLEGESLSGFDQVRVLQSYQRMVSFFQARVFEKMACISQLMHEVEADPEIAHDSATAEIGAELRLTRRAAEADVDLAVDLKERLPEVWEALASGRIDLRRARVIVEGTAHLSETATREVVDRIVEAATRLTTGQLRALIRKVCVQSDPDDAAVRYRESVDNRRIEMDPTVHGTAHLFGLDLPPDRVQAAMRRIADLAQSLKTSDETRTIDQIRADVFLDLLDGKHFARGGGRRGTVDIHVDLITLARLSEDPGELAGYGPVIADIARQVAENQPGAEWRWTLTHPDTGQVVDNGTTRRRPTAGQRRHVEARNRHCVFPGCRMPAIECDLDHNRPWAQGGPTTERNLAPLCRHNHHTKDRCGWTYRRLPNGDYVWTSRLGHTYTTSGLPP